MIVTTIAATLIIATVTECATPIDYPTVPTGAFIAVFKTLLLVDPMSC